ncbi:TPA: type III restriction endonuclease subunit R [Legionella pneumophila]|nr:type III restriction endonuclease subunit R [Legionella pneumophila]
MAIHPLFPKSPFQILDPDTRWFPAAEIMRETSMDKLIPPLVAQLRKQVKIFRDNGYKGASDTSRYLLNWWFNTPHLQFGADGSSSEFKYFFAQRESLETIIYLYDVVKAKDKFDLIRYDSTGMVSANMFDETWRRYVVKMATGSGKTKVISLALTWSYFHKLYEKNSDLARNFLIIAPNIIVLDRIYKDFQGLRIFFEDPLLPENGYEGFNWQDDFQLNIHLQDDVRIVKSTGNIFLTNIHRIYTEEYNSPSSNDENTMDFFLGQKVTGATTDSKLDLGLIIRDIDELMILNDEAHHIHDSSLAWFQSIQDIHNRLLKKGDALSLQIDVTATPKHIDGAIFVQTIADYPLVEAIWHNVVKHPILPDAASRSKLIEKQSSIYTEKYADYIDLGVIEWRKTFKEHEKMGKKGILFIMTDDTKNCDEVANYLEGRYPDLKNAVLVIHTKKNGDILESQSGKAKEELELLRRQSNEIDNIDSPYKVIVSVLMLKEGWDVRNVTTIVGLRAYASNILPEQTLGRGLRKMYSGNIEEYLSVIGTNAFMEFVESIQAEGVELERKPMGEGTTAKAPIVIEVDNDNVAKDINALDIQIPLLSARIYREYKNLSDISLESMIVNSLTYKEFSEEEQREIIFKDITTGEIAHTTIMDSAGIADYRSVIGYFAQTIIREMRLVSGYDLLYSKIRDFVQEFLFGKSVDLESPNTLRNLSELTVTKTVIETFKRAINELTVRDKGEVEIRDTIKLRNTRAFIAKNQDYLVPQKSIFNRVIGDSHLELQFARFLENCNDVVAYAKNYLSINFKLDYINADGNISNYYPDFIVKLNDARVVIVETKGLEDLDVPLKLKRLRQWIEDINAIQSKIIYDFVYVDEEGFNKYSPKSFENLLTGFSEYKY